MRAQDFSPFRPARPGVLTSLAGIAVVVSGIALGSGAAQAQSAANWLATAPAPTRALLFHAAEAPSPAFSSSLEPVLTPEVEGNAASEPAADPGLPEAPDPQIALEPKPKRGSDPAEHIARKNTMAIPSNWHAQRLTAGQKAKAGLEDLFTVEEVASWFLAAGWEQLTNGAPNYGTDKGAFGARLGAAAIRGTSQSLFTEVILAPAFHEDDRYYVRGPEHNFFDRTFYAVTRPLITRTDSGKQTVNAALLLGYAGSSALTPLYYPDINHNFTDVARVYGGGIGGAALGYFITEFSEDALRALHLNRAP